MSRATCPECGATFGTSHCRGGRYGGCCRTFSSDSAFDSHRTGPYSSRSCIDVTTAPGWRDTLRGWTDSAPMPEHLHRT